MKRIEAILFDFGGTLFEYYPPNAVVWANTAKKYGVIINPDDPLLAKAIIHQEEEYEKLLNAYSDGERGPVTEKDWFSLNSMLLSTIGINDPVAVITAQKAFDDRYGQFRIFPDSQSTLLGLKSSGIKLGLVSNVPPELLASRRELLLEHNILDSFDTIILSAEVGISKPDRRIFELALNEIAVADPTRAWYVGDSVINDVKGAKNAGMVPVLFDPLGMRDEDCLTIRTFSELIEMVKNTSI
ncbi:MAG: HAD family hydrolase [Candidatus Odinarchaeota archaeon]